jgi:hypothetical protein
MTGVFRVLRYVDVAGGREYVVYKLKGTGEMSLTCSTPVRMIRRVDLPDWKNVSNARQSRYHDMVLTR